MIEALKKYSEAGFLCLPTKTDKSPDVHGTWKGGIKDPEAYRNTHGIGIICGEGSGNLECFDFDNHFADAKDILSQFLGIEEVKEIYKKYALPLESTINGGYHLIYRCDKIQGNQKLAMRAKKEGNRWIPDTIIETRGEGGYFVADPTPGYKVIRNDICKVDTITSAEREILISAAKSFNTWYQLRKEESEQADRPGDLYNSRPEAIEDMKAALINAGWKELTEGSWQRPGKERGISATLGKVAPNVFYCFSSNGYPFDENSAYSPFQVVGLLKYQGDFKSFAKDLAKRNDLNGHRPQPGPSGENLKKKSESEYESILKASHIDLEVQVSKPPVIMRIRDIEGMDVIDKRLFTFGNFSATVGKSKSKKTFLANFFLTAAATNKTINSKIIPDIPENKRFVVLFDTEQSRYDAYVTASRIPKMAGYNPENFGCFNLREFTPLERCKIIEFALNRFRDSLGFVVIDGIADLATAINDEEEASRIVSLLMKWTVLYNCHIHVIIHENKGDNYATGHLGSAILKKAEVIISVKKDPDDYSRSTVSCNLIRGTVDFNDFDFVIDHEGIPRVETKSISIDNYYEPVKNEF